MTGHLAHIFRHPIKAIGWEEIKSAPLESGRALPFDRVWAVAHAKSKLVQDGQGGAAEWARKINFLTGASCPALMAVTLHSREDGRLMLEHPDLWHIEIDPTRPEDADKLFEWLRPIWPSDKPQPTALLRAPDDQPLMDQSRPLISLIGAASLEDLGAKLGQPLARPRFRANLWVDGWAPFAEFDLIGKHLRIGEAVLEPVARIGRCRATDANPSTGLRDIDMLKALETHYGHTDLGVFCSVIEAGDIARGDPVEVI
ncbi:MOSC domain-containing protein [Thioclava sp. BHET1]|nr:MOSC domain-containing protein [Thioclava sp. BHET1]